MRVIDASCQISREFNDVVYKTRPDGAGASEALQTTATAMKESESELSEDARAVPTFADALAPVSSYERRLAGLSLMPSITYIGRWYIESYHVGLPNNLSVVFSSFSAAVRQEI
jgi:hypothetical protein